MDSELDQLIGKKDWRATQVARAAGPGIIPSLQSYLNNRDPVIRLLAVDCLAAIGGHGVTQLLISMLGDSNEQVRIDAINALHQNLPLGKERALLAAAEADHSPDGFVRQQVPMILGRMQARETIPELRHRLTAEKGQDIRDGLIAGMAKMGDAQARVSFGELLHGARGKRTAELIEYVKYLDEPWVIPMLVPVLQRRDIAVDLSTHRKSLHRRECDLAVDEVLRITKAKFSFQLDPIAQYSDTQISEALHYAQAQER
jgi:hypothetical protein